MEKPFAIPSWYDPRTKLVDEVIKRVQFSRIFQVRGTPASGKTTLMQLVGNKLFASSELVYAITGWDRERVEPEGWRRYLKRMTGPQDWICMRSDYLLLYDAQESRWDVEVWSELFKAIDFRPLGLLFSEDEAINVVTQFAATMQPPLSLSMDAARELFYISNGHAGLLHALLTMSVADPLVPFHTLQQSHGVVDVLAVRNFYLGRPTELFRFMAFFSNDRVLPTLAALQIRDVACVSKKAVANDRILHAGLDRDEELELIWRHGWLHLHYLEWSDRYIFSTPLHHWYCHCLLEEMESGNDISHVTLIDLTVDCIKRFRPYRLSNSPRSLAGHAISVQHQYQEKFYRSLFDAIDGIFTVSPELAIRASTLQPEGGRIDLIVPHKKLGIQLLRDRDEIVEAMERFEPGGQYYGKIQSGDVEYFVVLDFTITKPIEARPEYKDRLYHVFFSENFRVVEVLNAADLSVRSSFTLEEYSEPPFTSAW